MHMHVHMGKHTHTHTWLTSRPEPNWAIIAALGPEGDTAGDKVHADLGVGLGRGQQTAGGRASPSPSAEPLSVTLMDALDPGGLIGLSGFFHFMLLLFLMEDKSYPRKIPCFQVGVASTRASCTRKMKEVPVCNPTCASNYNSWE